jgi:hypothetical protein
VPDDNPVIQSCPLCLQADELLSMVTLHLEQVAQPLPNLVRLCRTCARQIAEAWAELQNEENPPASKVEPNSKPDAVEN